MDFEQARAYIEKIRLAGSSYGLDGIRSLMEKLGNVQNQLRVIHVAGTNGKGSVCAMVSAILKEAGYLVGCYSSPAVFHAEEIYKINGEMISKEDYAGLFTTMQELVAMLVKEGRLHPSAFEIETAAAFSYFAKRGCEYVVLETGLGGTQDATNIVSRPLCSVITSISRDHMALLGNSLSEIALAKAGIIKEGCSCVSAGQEPEVLSVLMRQAERMHSRLYVAWPEEIEEFEVLLDQKRRRLESRFRFRGAAYRMPLAGAFQKENLACVKRVVDLLREKGAEITAEAIRRGFEAVCLPGRMECLCLRPEFYIDGAHNEGAALFLRKTLENYFTNRRIVYIIGVLADKEYDRVLEIMLPLADTVYTVTPPGPRALSSAALADAVKAQSEVYVEAAKSVEEAVHAAVRKAGEDGMVLAFGSFTYLNEVKAAIEAASGREIDEDRK